MTTSTIILSEEDYIQMELGADIRHELINETLIDMPEDSPIHNFITGTFYIIFRQLLKSTDYSIFMEDVKLKIPDEKNTFTRTFLSLKKSLIPLPGIFYMMWN